MSYFTSISLHDSGNLDAFSRLRVANSESLFAVQNNYSQSSLKMEVGATGTGVTPAWDSNTRMVTVSATAGTGTAFIQSYGYYPYQPGKSHLVKMTFVVGAAVASAVVDAGLFDAANGIFFRQNGTSGLQFVRRTSTSGSVVNNTVDQSSWNLDKLDGTGASGITLDITKAQILIIDLQFLGMGRVRVGFDIGGVIVYVHEFLNANSLTVPFMQTATLPVQMLLTATSTGSTKTSYFKCAAVDSEGGITADSGYQFATPSGSVTAASGARTHILSLRPKTTFNSVTNRMMINLDDLQLVVTGANPVYWELVIGAAFSGAPTWADVNTTYSGTEYATGGTFSNLTNGLVLQCGYIAASTGTKSAVSVKFSKNYPLTLDRAGAQRALGTLSLLVRGIGGTSDTQAAFNFSEVR